MSKEAMKLALEALKYIEHNYMSLPAPAEKAITALRKALAEQKSGIKQVIELYDSPDQPSQQEPVALKPCWYESKEKTMCRKCGQIHSEAISPAPQRTWVGLTDGEVVDLKMLGRDLEFVSMTALRRFARDIAQTLKEKNT